MAVVGIDLGTTNSLIAVYQDDHPQLVPNALGAYLTPSVVGISDGSGEAFVGKAAQSRLVRHPERTKAMFKRQMGTNAQNKLGKQTYGAVELSSMVLKSLKQDAENYLQEEVQEAVISVPAYFNAVQRQATIDAAELAGLKVRRLINEPTAAALANGVLDRDDESTFVVLDLGGGTFDVSILEMFDGVMEVRASSGDAFLGGEDFSDMVAQHLAGMAEVDWKKASAATREKLLDATERLKRALDGKQEVSVSVELENKIHELRLSQTVFERVCSSLIARLNRPIERCLYDASISANEIDRVILVGGATRMHVVRSLAAKIFKKLPERKIDPDHAIALGAAIQAGLIEKHQSLDDIVMTDVAPFSMGVETNHDHGESTIHGAFAPILERNTILPASRVQYFCTRGNNQTEIELKIYQGESAIARDNILLGEMTVPVPPKPAGEETIEVRFTYDVSGLLAIDVKVLSLDKTISTVIDNLAGALSKTEKSKRLKAMDKLKINPRETAQNAALIEAIKHLHQMLLGEDRAYAMSLLGRFEAALATQDPKKIDAERDKISEILEQIEASFVSY
jgi:molecular chaperone HscC